LHQSDLFDVDTDPKVVVRSPNESNAQLARMTNRSDETNRPLGHPVGVRGETGREATEARQSLAREAASRGKLGAAARGRPSNRRLLCPVEGG